MNVEVIGRQYNITPAVRKEVEAGLEKLTKILGDSFKSKVILSLEKHRNIAEITIKRRANDLVGLGESTDMRAAIGEALDHIEKQALKHNGRRRNIKRKGKADWKESGEEQALTIAVGASPSTAVPMTVHKFPSVTRTTEAHLTRSQDAVALRPMTVEEAVKECEFRDREVFVFRDKKGRVNVLHRRKDGKIELIEAP
jgi:putative sigma-54 modulation protein